MDHFGVGSGAWSKPRREDLRLRAVSSYGEAQKGKITETTGAMNLDAGGNSDFLGGNSGKTLVVFSRSKQFWDSFRASKPEKKVVWDHHSEMKEYLYSNQCRFIQHTGTNFVEPIFGESPTLIGVHVSMQSTARVWEMY